VKPRDPLATLAVLATLASFLLLAAAMATYPGGRWLDTSSSGFDLVHNYLCDLIRPAGHNGHPNVPGMQLARAGMLAQAVGLLALWWLVPRYAPQRRWLGRLLRSAGTTGSLLLPFVAFTPSDGTSRVHALAIAASGAPSLLALLLASALLLAERRRWPRLARLTALFVLVALVNAVLYVSSLVATWPDAWSLPLAQKVAWVLLVGWIVAVACAAPRAGDAEP
jgi:hypothetical protein